MNNQKHEREPMCKEPKCGVNYNVPVQKNDNKQNEPLSTMQLELQRIKLMLAAEPVLLTKLIEALEAQHFFITVSYQKRRKINDQSDLQHFYVIKGYPPNDVPHTLDHLLNSWLAQNQPTAELKKEKQGHWH